MPTAAEHTFARLTAWLRLAIELLSVATATSFIISAAILFSIFRIWNLDFFALASVSDVIMGGAFILCFILALAIAMAGLIATFLLFKEQSRILFGFIGAIFLLNLILVGILVASRAGVINEGWFFVYRSWSNVIFLALMGTMAIWVLLARPLEVYEKFRAYVDDIGKAIRLAIGSLLALVIMLIFYLANLGFAGIYSFPRSDQQTAYGCPSRQVHFMWVGERSIVMRCGRELRVLLEREGLLIRKVRDRDIVPRSEYYLWGI